MYRDDVSTGFIRAMDVEVRVSSGDTRPTPWADHPDEAEHWIYEIVQGVFRETVGGVVEMDRRFAEPDSFTQHLSVFASPTPENLSIARGDLRGVASRIQNDLCAKFGTTNPPPLVRVDPDKSFLSAQTGSTDAVAIVPQPIGTEYSHAPGGVANQAPSRPRGSALMWTGAALGGMLIANIFLLSNNFDLKSKNADMAANAVEITKLEAAQTQERFAWKTAMTQKDQVLRNYSQAAIRHFDDLNKQIDDLAKKKGLSRPPVLTPPSPPTVDPFYEEPVDPFAELTADTGNN